MMRDQITTCGSPGPLSAAVKAPCFKVLKLQDDSKTYSGSVTDINYLQDVPKKLSWHNSISQLMSGAILANLLRQHTNNVNQFIYCLSK